MNKQQYFRLTGVLVILFVILSWWLSQQDFILEQGTVIECDWKENSCGNVYEVPLENLTSEDDYGLNYYNIFGDETVFRITHFDAPIEAQYQNSEGKFTINPIISAEILERNACEVSGINNYYSYYCFNESIPSELSSGHFSFINEDDANRLKELVSLAQKKIDSYNHIYVWTAVIIFISLFVFYLLISYIVKFIIYGFRKK